MTVHTTRETVRSHDAYDIVKVVHTAPYSGRTKFAVYERHADGSPRHTWVQSGEPASSIAVDVYHPHRDYGDLTGAQVSWPSTGDKRPALARALAEVLVLATDEADRLDADAAEQAQP